MTTGSELIERAVIEFRILWKKPISGNALPGSTAENVSYLATWANLLTVQVGGISLKPWKIRLPIRDHHASQTRFQTSLLAPV